jgi:hypothetical protein
MLRLKEGLEYGSNIKKGMATKYIKHAEGSL